MESFKEIENYYSKDNTECLKEYLKSHKPRLDFLFDDLNLKDIKDQNICEFGAGSGYLLRKMDQSNNIIAIDGYHIEQEDYVIRSTFNLDQPYADDFLQKYDQIDTAFSFEVFEHLTNPYNFVFELKKILKEDGILYLSVPHEATQHNTFYPGLIYPVQNLIQFFEQMAFQVKHYKIHSKRFVQNVLVLQNKSWAHVKMLWPKGGGAFKNQPPHIQINL